MKVIKKNVYYCDYCNKRALRSLLKHENSCTANPKRECKLCGRTDRKRIPEIIKGFKDRFKIGMDDFAEEKIIWIGEKITIEEIKKVVGDCPNCILTILRCAKFQHPFDFEYNYKEEMQKHWAEVNSEQQDYHY